MQEFLIDCFSDSLMDSIKLVPFLFITYLIMEYIEHKTGDKTKKIIKKSGKYGPLLGGILGIFPQCGFSSVAANLYAGKIITMGTLIAIFLSTSDEMLPILISEAAPISLILQILGIKLVIGIIAGFLVDFAMQAFRKMKKQKVKELKEAELKEEKIEEEIEHMCEHEHCDCEHEGVVKSALKHTVNIFTFIFIISFVINIVIMLIGEENLSNIILNTPILGPVIAGVVGLIPNCAASVILTQLYLQDVITIGSMIAGLLVGSGIGTLILFRVNKNIKENLKIIGILYFIAILSGIIIDLIL